MNKKNKLVIIGITVIGTSLAYYFSLPTCFSYLHGSISNIEGFITNTTQIDGNQKISEFALAPNSTGHIIVAYQILNKENPCRNQPTAYDLFYKSTQNPGLKYIGIAQWGKNSWDLIPISNTKDVLMNYEITNISDNQVSVKYIITAKPSAESGNGYWLNPIPYAPSNIVVTIGQLHNGNLPLLRGPYSGPGCPGCPPPPSSYSGLSWFHRHL